MGGIRFLFGKIIRNIAQMVSVSSNTITILLIYPMVWISLFLMDREYDAQIVNQKRSMSSFIWSNWTKIILNWPKGGFWTPPPPLPGFWHLGTFLQIVFLFTSFRYLSLAYQPKILAKHHGALLLWNCNVGAFLKSCPCSAEKYWPKAPLENF